MKRFLLIGVLIAMLAAILSTAPPCYSAIPYRGPHSGESDLSQHEADFVPQEWSFQRTITNAVLSKSTAPCVRLIVPTDFIPSKPDANGTYATIGIEPVASGHIYLNNLNLRF